MRGWRGREVGRGRVPWPVIPEDEAVGDVCRGDIGDGAVAVVVGGGDVGGDGEIQRTEVDAVVGIEAEMGVLSVAERVSAEECLRAADCVCVTAPVVGLMLMVKTAALTTGVAESVPVRVSPSAWER